MENLNVPPVAVEKVPVPGVQNNSPKTLDASMNVKNAEFLLHLGLKYEMYNPQVIEKVQYLADRLPDIKALQEIDIRLGDDGRMPKLDRIYCYLNLLGQSQKIQEEKNLVDENIRSYERS